MREFSKEFTAGQPSLRIGSSVPKDSVNIGFINTPNVTADQVVQIFDYSHTVPENNQPISTLESTMFRTHSELLADKSGNSLLPVRTLVVTDKYSSNDTPLFYKYTSRYLHYEADTGDGVYSGQNIYVSENGSPTSQPHIIEVVAEAQNEYRVTVYSSFKTTGTTTFYLHYNKKADGKLYPAHKEIMNCTSAMAEVDSDPDDAEYAIEEAPDSEGYFIKVNATPTSVTRSPILFRWRMRKNDTDVTPWRTSYILMKHSLQDADYDEYENAFDGSREIARKKLCNRPAALFSPYSDTDSFSITGEDIQIYDNGVWVNNSSYTGDMIKVSTISPTSPVYIWANDGYAGSEYDTGAADTTDTTYFKVYPKSTLTFTISGEANVPPEFIPAQKINWSRAQLGATASWKNWDSFKNAYASVTSNPSGVLGKLTSPISFILNWILNWDQPAYGKTLEGSGAMPAHQYPIVRITFPSPRSIDELEIVFGRTGSLGTVELRNSSDALIESVSGFTQTGGTYRKTLATPVANVKYLDVQIVPTQYKTVDYWWLFEIFGLRDRFVGEWNLVCINAYENVPASSTDPLYWGASASFTVDVSKSGQYKKSLKNLIEEAGLVPDNVELRDSDCIYTITAESEDPACYIELIDSMGMSICNSGEWKCDYLTATNESNPVYIVGATDASEVAKSPRYSIRTTSFSNICIESIGEHNTDEMWFLKIRNGRFTIKDNVTKLIRRFHVPEFGTQAFDSTLGMPYMKQVDEEATFIDERTIKVANTPMHVSTLDGSPTDLTVTKNGVSVGVLDWDIEKGEIRLAEDIELSDTVLVTYIHEQQSLVYKGYASEGNFYHLDLNPLPGHTYTDQSDLSERPSSELLDKAIFIYILPSYSYYADYSGSPTYVDTSTVRHIITDEDVSIVDAKSLIPSNAHILAKVNLVRPISYKDIVVLDSRVRGGGVKESVTYETLSKSGDEATHYWDLSSWDGYPYPCNGVIIITLKKSLLKEFGGKFTERDIRNILSRYIAFGVYPIITYID